jgi:hypothetical protein
MKTTSKLFAVALAAFLVAGGVAAQVDLSRYVALGDSVTAAYASGGLTKAYQDTSYPALLAGQFGVSGFQQPTVSNPGIPAVLELKQLMVVNGQVVPVIAAKSGQGAPTNATLATPYNNLGIPGAKVNDLLTKKGNIQNLITGQINPATLMYDLILRDNTTTAIQQAIGLQGTFYSVWAGSNDVLGAAVAAVAIDGVTLTPAASFQTQYATLIGALRQNRPTAKLVVATIPDVTAIPFVTTVKPYIFTAQGQKVYLLGEAGPLTDSDYVTLAASALIQQGYGIPGTGKLLPEGSFNPATMTLTQGVILRIQEANAIRTRTNELNNIIKGVAASAGAAVVDMAEVFADIGMHGYHIGGVTLTTAFLTGGLFSYDGVHPQNLAHAIVANEFIEVINSAYGATVPLVNLRPFLTGSAATTSVLAAQVIFTPEAHRQLLTTLLPDVQLANATPIRPVQRRLGGSGRPAAGGIINP